MIIFKKFLINIISLFVFIKYKNIWNIRKHLVENKIYSGPVASTYYMYLEKHCSFIGINAELKDIPYFPHNVNGIFISNKSKIGKNCVIFQQVTIGSVMNVGSKHNGSPTIGDNCYIGAGAKIIGNIKVGDNVRIGANAIVNKDVPDNSTVYGNPMQIKTHKKKLDNRYLNINEVTNEVQYWDNEERKFKAYEK